MMIPFTGSFAALLFISILYGLGFSMVTSSTPALISELAEKNLVGTGMGFLSTIMDIGQTLGPIATGFILASALGYSGSFASLTVILLVACGIFVGIRTTRSRRQNVDV
jgi:MFS family permease